jgi:uncharacterized RDD family membrane protein YckC
MTPTQAPVTDVSMSRQGHYGGAASRLAAFGADVGASWGIYTAGVALVSLASQLATGRTVSLGHHQIAAGVVLALWEFVYFSYPWSVSGRTIGMALFGLQVVNTQGTLIGPRQAILRTLFLPLSIALLGLGFLGILFQRERRALHDLVAGTVVVYSWDARAAHLRWMARQEVPAQG